jgi:hypothetical protein
MAPEASPTPFFSPTDDPLVTTEPPSLTTSGSSAKPLPDPTTLAPTQPRNTDTGCPVCGESCKWEIPFWILFVAMVTSLGIAVLTTFLRCCYGKYFGIAEEKEEKETYTYFEPNNQQCLHFDNTIQYHR